MVASITQVGLPVNATFRNIITRVSGFAIANRATRAQELFAWADSLLDHSRFGDLDRVLLLHGDLVEDDAAFPDAETIATLGVDAYALAICLQGGFITPEQVGAVLKNVQENALAADDFNTAIYALVARGIVVREPSLDDVDYDALSRYRVDTGAVEDCLQSGALSAAQIIELLDGLNDGRLTTGEFDTAVAAFHDDGIGAQRYHAYVG